MFSIAIQAGGESRRMGRNKALMLFLGEPLIQRVWRRVSKLSDDIFITANLGQDYSFLPLSVYNDVISSTGALSGLFTALVKAKKSLVAVVACDMPFVNPQLLMAEAQILVGSNMDVVLPHSPDGFEPLHAVYRRETCLPTIQEFLQQGEFKLLSWLERVKVQKITADEMRAFDPDLRAFINVNTLEEFEQAEQLAREIEESV